MRFRMVLKKIAPILICSGYAVYKILERNSWHFSGFEWPSMDMGGFFERMRDPSFLKGDFTVDSMSAPNPRWIFGFQVLGLSRLLGIDWADGLTLFALIAVIVVPGLLFLFFSNASRVISKSNNEEEQSNKDIWITIFSLISVLFILSTERMQYRWMLGDYPQTEFKATAHGFAVLWALLGSHFRWNNRLKIGTFFMAIATLTHPAIGFIWFCIQMIFESRESSFRRVIVSFFYIVPLPYLTLFLAFHAPHVLDTNSFIEIYVKGRLPHHYWVGSFDSGQIKKVLGAFTLSVFSCSFFLLVLRRYWGALCGLFSIVLVNFFVFSQWFFVDKFPFKPVILMAPIRICAFYWWVIAVFVIACLAIFASRLTMKFKWVEKLNMDQKEEKFSSRILGVPSVTILIFWLILGLFVWKGYRINSIELLKNSEKELYDWIETTSPHAVYAAPVDAIGDHLPLVGKRAVFISQVFPFREDYYAEYKRRWRLLFGDNRSYRNEYFHKLKLTDFQEITKNDRIDYVIVQKGFNSPLESKKPIVESKSYKVYPVRQFMIGKTDAKS